MAGNIHIIHAQDNYQRVAKSVIFSETIDVATLGIYVKVLVLGEKWKLNVKGLASALKVSPERIRKAFALLEELGYLRRQKGKNESGKFSGWDYEISAVPFDQIAEKPTSEKPDVGETRHRENPTSEKADAYIDIISGNRDYINNPLSRKDNISAGGREFDFYEALRGLGVSEETAEDWRKVRRSLKACDTRTAFDVVAEEISRSGKSAEDCIRLAAANSWRGFRAAWIREENSPRPSYPTGERRRLSNYEKALIAQDEEFGTHAYQDFCHEREERRRAQAAASQPDDQ